MRKSGELASWCADALRPAAALLALSFMAAVATALWHPNRPASPSTGPTEKTADRSPQLTLAEIRQDARFAHAFWVDARPAEAYARGHVPGALRLTEAEWETGFPALIERWPPDAPIIVYCSSASCDLSQQVADRLRRELGVSHVYVLRGGWEAWRP